jgi:alkylation response protein AidB-like acyl-CoA dehydrogenase
MDFAFTPEQIELRRAVRDFAEAEIGPHVRKWDDSEIFPLETIKKLGALGYMGAILPEELGGAGLGYIEYCIIIEELSRVDGSIGIILAAHTSLCANHIYKSGTDSQRNLYIPRLASGEWLGCWALTEPSAGSDASGTQTRAVFDGQWTLDGSKSFITNAHYADVCVAMAVTDAAAGTEGFRVGKKEEKLGLRASATGEVVFENCRLDNAQLLGAAGAGFIDSMKVLDGGRVSIAALAIGMAQGAYDAALSYSQSRKQFGQSICEFQLIQKKLVDMAVSLDAARFLTYRAAWLLDRGRRVTKESAMAKLFASEAAVQIANEAVQIYGGYGFIKDYPVEKFYRDIKLCTIGEGTSEIQTLVIARQLLSPQDQLTVACS